MNTLDDMIPYVLPDVPGASEGIIRMRLREAMRKFCREAEIWHESIELDSVADQAAYDVNVSYDAYIKRIVHVKIRTADTTAFDNVERIHPSKFKLNDDADGIVFYSGYEPTTSLTDGIEVKVALMPNPTIESFSGVLMDRYGEGIYAYAKYRLQRVKRTPYYDPEAARENYTEYQGTLQNAIKERYTENKDVNTQIQQLGNLL